MNSIIVRWSGLPDMDFFAAAVVVIMKCLLFSQFRLAAF